MTTRKNYFAKLVKYMNNVYNIDRLFNLLEDARVNPKYKTGLAVMPLLLGLLLRVKSINTLKFMIKENEFSKVFPRGKKLPQIDTIRDAFKVINLERLKAILRHIVNTAIRNKTFANGTIDVKMIKKIVHKLDPVVVWGQDAEFERVSVFESTFKMDTVNRPLRFVKFEIKRMDGRYNQILIVTSCLNMKLEILFKMIRSRWDIENSIFNNLKTECGLEHCYVHGGNAVEAVLYLIFITANIM